MEAHLAISTVVLGLVLVGQCLSAAGLELFTCQQDLCNKHGAYQYCNTKTGMCIDCRLELCGKEDRPSKCNQYCHELAVKEAEENLKSQECPLLGNITNGSHNGHKTGLSAQGTSVESHCDAGYQLQGAPLTVCEEFGHWSNKLPVCIELKCESLAFLNHGSHNGTEFGPGTMVNFECDAGYQLEGALSTVCTEQGHWSNQIPFCKESQCGPPASIMNGSIAPNRQSYSPGDRVEYQCDDGYSLTGIGSQWNCQEDGTWDQSVVPVCLPNNSLSGGSFSDRKILIWIIACLLALIGVGVVVSIWCLWKKWSSSSTTKPSLATTDEERVPLQNSETNDMPPPAEFETINELPNMGPPPEAQKVSERPLCADPLPPRNRHVNPRPVSLGFPVDGAERNEPRPENRGRSRSPTPVRGGDGHGAAGDGPIPAANSNPRINTRNSSRSSGLGSEESSEDERGNGRNIQLTGQGVNINLHFNNNISNHNHIFNNKSPENEKPPTPNAHPYCKLSTEETKRDNISAKKSVLADQPDTVQQPIPVVQQIRNVPNNERDPSVRLGNITTISPIVCTPEPEQPMMVTPSEDDAHATKLAINNGRTITRDDVCTASS